MLLHTSHRTRIINNLIIEDTKRFAHNQIPYAHVQQTDCIGIPTTVANINAIVCI